MSPVRKLVRFLSYCLIFVSWLTINSSANARCDETGFNCLYNELTSLIANDAARSANFSNLIRVFASNGETKKAKYLARINEQNSLERLTSSKPENIYRTLSTLAREKSFLGYRTAAMVYWDQAEDMIQRYVDPAVMSLAFKNLAIDQILAGHTVTGLNTLEHAASLNPSILKEAFILKQLGASFYNSGEAIDTSMLSSLLKTPTTIDIFFGGYFDAAHIGQWKDNRHAEAASQKAYDNLIFWETRTNTALRLTYFYLRRNDVEQANLWAANAVEDFVSLCPSSPAAYEEIVKTSTTDFLPMISDAFLDIGKPEMAEEVLELRKQNNCFPSNDTTKGDVLQSIQLALFKADIADVIRKAADARDQGLFEEMRVKIPGSYENLSKKQLEAYFKGQLDFGALPVNSGKLAAHYALKIFGANPISDDEFKDFSDVIQSKRTPFAATQVLLWNHFYPTAWNLIPFFDDRQQLRLLERYAEKRSTPQGAAKHFSMGHFVVKNRPFRTEDIKSAIERAYALMSPGQIYEEAKILAEVALQIDEVSLAEDLKAHVNSDDLDGIHASIIKHHVLSGNLEQALKMISATKDSRNKLLLLTSSLEACSELIVCKGY